MSERRRLTTESGQLHFADVADVDRASYSAVPATAPLRTLRDCVEANVAPGLVRQAILQSRRRGLITPENEARLMAELERLPAVREADLNGGA